MIRIYPKAVAFTIVLLLVFFFANASLKHYGLAPFAFMASTEKLDDPELTGPDQLCNVYGSVRGAFSGGGNPATDVYKWTILAPDGSVLFTRPPGAFQTIEYTFELLGSHKVKLEVSRGGIVLGDFEKSVEIIQGPTLTLATNYQFCQGQLLPLQAISPSSPYFANYIFEWTDESNSIVGNSNTLEVSSPGRYQVTFHILDSDGSTQCQTTLATTVSLLESVAIVQSSSTVCRDGAISFESDPPTTGQWYLTIPGQADPKPLGRSNHLTLIPSFDLPSFGNYTVKLQIENPDNPACAPQATADFTYNEEPVVAVTGTTGASDCYVPDGALEFTAITNLDKLIVGDGGLSYGPFSAGETINIPNLESGAYTLYAILNGCVNTTGTVVPLDSPPSELEFSIENVVSESCTPTGKDPGSFEVNLKNGITEGSFRVLTERGDEVLKEALPGENPFKITLGGGKYFFEILNKDSCNLPNRDFVEIPGKVQTNFQLPETLTICGFYDLIPETSENLLFTLTDPSGNQSSKVAGEAFTITEEGEYNLVGILPDQDEICPTSRTITVTTTNPIAFDPVLISEDCVIGNRIFEAEIYGYDPSLANFFWRNAAGDIIGTGQSLFLSPTSIGVFSLEVQPKNSEACPISPKEFTVEAPVLFVDASITSTKLCEFGPEAIVELTTTSPEAVTDIKWRRFNEEGEIVELPEFNNQTTITTRIGGTYEASAYSIIPAISKNCELGRVTFQLDLTPDKVEFDIPRELSICDFYEIIPQTSQDLTFFLTTPSGTVIEKTSGQPFSLDEAGTYTFLAFDNNSPTAYCPEQKELVVTLADAVDFQPILFEEFCDGSRTYQASIGNYAVEDVDISWKDMNGNPVGNGEFLTLTTPGMYSLEVQPANTIPCHISPKPFEVLPPVLAVDVSLVSDPFCPDAPAAAIRAEADFSSVSRIEWWYSSPTGEQSELVGERNQKEIMAINEGTYEVRLFNHIPCLLGYDKILILRSTDTVRPEVEESYQICPKYEIAPTINPGSFASYAWYYGDQLVSTSPTYKPLLVGDYSLIVFSEEGCAYQTSFTTEEECELRVIYPNAVQPGNPDKAFLLYTNYLVDELDLVILNKWGQVIFQCSQTNLISEESICAWDGTFQGEAIPNGTYAVRVDFKNYEKNISKSEFGAILIIE